MVWLGFQFDTLAMTVTLPPDKLREIMDLVGMWLHKTTSNVQDLRSLFGKLLFVGWWPCTKGVFLIHIESRTPIPLYADACISGCGSVTTD